MERTLEAAGSDDSGVRLLRILLDRFPTGYDVDYFELCGVPSTQSLLTPDHISRFNAIQALIEILEREGFGHADRFSEGRRTYFWNVRITSEAFVALERAFDAVENSGDGDVRRVLAVATTHVQRKRV